MLLDGPPESGGIKVAADNGVPHFPVATAYSLGHHLVVWGRSDGNNFDWLDGEVRANRLRAGDAHLLDGSAESEGISIERTGGGSPFISVSGGRRSFVVATSVSPDVPENTGYGVVTVHSVRAYDGAVSAFGALGDTGIPPKSGQFGMSATSVSFDGRRFVVAYSAIEDTSQPWLAVPVLFGVRFDEANGARLDQAPFVITRTLANGDGNTNQWRSTFFRTAFDGRNVLAVWEDTRGGLYASRIDPARAAVLDGSEEGAGFLLQNAPLSRRERVWDRQWDLTAGNRQRALVAYRGPTGEGAHHARSRSLGRFVNLNRIGRSHSQE